MKSANGEVLGERQTLSGTVMQIIYQNKSNDYTVFELLTDGDEQLTAVGSMPFLMEEDEVILYGSFVHHPEHGEQFSVDAFEKRLPADVHSILRYLSSKHVKGIGPVTALKIVNRYGVDSFDVIENHPEWLADIPGITAKRAAEINKSFGETVGMRNLLLFCKDMLPSSAVTRIYKRFGGESVVKIRENPYCLCECVHGIGFERADAIAESLHFDMHSPHRIVSALAYLLSYHASTNGHACMPLEKLLSAASTLLGLPLEEVRAVLEREEAAGILRAYTADDGTVYLYNERTAVAEEGIVRLLKRIAEGAPVFSFTDAAAITDRLEASEGITFADAQRQAIYDSLSSGVMILTGGPGTGKTTVIRGLLRIFEDLGIQTALAAPTGRAAKRMQESTGEEAKTVHRMLEMESADGELLRFLRNEENPLDAKAVIVDEASMLDIPLFYALLRAMPRKSRLILIGDASQLPPVGAGNILCDLIESGVFRTVHLDHIFRQSAESRIVLNAHRINEGEMPDLTLRDRDFFFLPRASDAEIASTVVSLASERLPRAYGEGISEKIQVISPQRRGICGTENLNLLLQARLNPHTAGKKELRFRDRFFREGDRVMQTRNNYDIEWKRNGAPGRGIFNGDIGVITEIRSSDETLTILFDDRLAVYEFALLEELSHAYAITVHKSQGSEYGVVILPLFSCAPMLKTRNLIYTAVTRAREMVVLVGYQGVLREMVENERQTLRYSLLDEKLRHAFSEEQKLC